MSKELMPSYVDLFYVRNSVHRKSVLINVHELMPSYVDLFCVRNSVHRKSVLINVQRDATIYSVFIAANCSTYFGC